MKTRLMIVSLLVTSIFPAVGRGQGHTERGAVLGGIAGALGGAAIGNNNGETAAGALIGGALGLITGSAIGNSIDADERRRRAYQYQVMEQRARAVSVADVVTMTHNGLSEQVIVNHIRQHGVQRRIEVADVIALHKQGVSEAAITAMQQAPVAPIEQIRTPRPRPVVVEEYHYVPPAYYHHHHYHRPHYYHHHRHHRGGGVHWGITIGR